MGRQKLKLRQVRRHGSLTALSPDNVRQFGSIRPSTRIGFPKNLKPLTNYNSLECLLSRNPSPASRPENMKSQTNLFAEKPDLTSQKEGNTESEGFKKRSTIRLMTSKYLKDLREDYDLHVVNTNIKWHTKPARGIFPMTRAGASLIAMGNKAYLYGGHWRQKFTQVFSMNLNTFKWDKKSIKSAGAPEERTGTLVLAYKHYILVHGGSQSTLSAFNERNWFYSIYLFDTQQSTWSTFASRGADPVSRRYHGGAIIADRLIIFGGQNSKSKVLSDVASLDLKTRKWEFIDIKNSANIPQLLKFTATPVYPRPAVNQEVTFYKASDFYDGVYNAENTGIYVFGGKDQHDEVHNDLYIISGAIKRYQGEDQNTLYFNKVETQGTSPRARYSHWAQFIHPYLYIYLGRNDEMKYEQTPYAVDRIGALNIKTMSWEHVKAYGQSPEGRWDAASCKFNEKIFIFGGMKLDSFHNTDTHVFDTNQHRINKNADLDYVHVEQKKVKQKYQMISMGKKLLESALTSGIQSGLLRTRSSSMFVPPDLN